MHKRNFFKRSIVYLSLIDEVKISFNIVDEQVACVREDAWRRSRGSGVWGWIPEGGAGGLVFEGECLVVEVTLALICFLQFSNLITWVSEWALN